MTFYETIVRLYPHARVQPLSIDEFFVSIPYDRKCSVETIMSNIRNQVRVATGGLECSVGGALDSPIYARMATKDAKPSGQKYVSNPYDFVSRHALRDLPGVGRAISRELERNGYRTCADIQNSRLDSSFLLNLLKQWFGHVVGEKIWSGARGESRGEIKDVLDMEKDKSTLRQSVSVEVNWGVRFEDGEDKLLKQFILQVAEELYRRLRGRVFEGMNIRVMIRRKDRNPNRNRYTFLGHGYCRTKSNSFTCGAPLRDIESIHRVAMSLYV